MHVKINEVMGDMGTVALVQDGAHYSVDREIEKTPGVFKCENTPFTDMASAMKYYQDCIKGVLNTKREIAGCGIFQKSSR